MFCVGRGSTVNNDVLAAQRKHEKTLGIIRIMPFSVKMSVFCRCFMRGVKPPQIPTHNQRKENTIKHYTFIQIRCDFVYIPGVLRGLA